MGDETESASLTRAERRAAAAEKRRDRLSGAIGVLLGGLLAIGAGVASSYLSAESAREAQREQFLEDRRTEDRATKREVYLAFTDAADSYALATTVARDCVEAARPVPPETTVALTEDCAAKVAELAPSRFRFQAARNSVFFYGSVRAEEQARIIAAYLPPAVGGDPLTGLPELGVDFQSFDYSHFGELYRNFNEIVRCEVPAEPRPGCPP